MNIRLFGTLFCVMCAIYPMVCVAEFVHVPNGATVSIDGKRSTTFTVNGSSVKNVINNVLVADGDATIVVTYPSTTSGGLYCGLVATNGTVTLDLTAIEGRDFVLDYGASVKGDGVLRVKGRDSICLGGTYADGAPADVVNLEYVDATDTPYSEPEGLILTNQFLEWNLPTTTPWHLAAEATPIIIKSGSAIAAALMENGTLTLTNRELMVFNAVALPPSAAPIAIGNGGILTLVRRNVTEATYFSQAGTFETYTNAFNIAAGGELNLSGRYTINMTGAISGSGTLRFTASADNKNATTTVYDADSFTGEVICETAGNTLAFAKASPGAGGNNVTLLKDGCSLRLGTSAAAGYTGSIGVLTGPSIGSATLALPDSKAGTLAIASRSGNVTITGAGYGKTTVELGSIREGETVATDVETVKYELAAAALSSPGVFSLVRTNGRNVYVRSADASSVDFGKFDIPASGTYSLEAANGVTYQNVPENVCLEVGSGVSAALAAQTNVEARVRMEGGSLDVSPYVPDFASKVQFWMDSSDRSSVVSSSTRSVSGISYPIVAGMNDTRAEQTSVKLVYTKDTASTWPTLITNGVNGLDYLSCGAAGNERIWFGNSIGIAPRFAIMVFGSQRGGGQAIIGNTAGYYCRGGTLSQSITKDAPIFSRDIDTWVNGEKVDATERSLSGGWEIISFDTSGANVHGFGFNNAVGSASNAKGQNYGEVLLFSETPTEAERVAAEKYLAQKWGVSGYSDAGDTPTFAIRAEGNGSITLSADVELSGSFAGTVNMNGNTLSVVDDPLPPGEEAVVSNGRLAWFDPDEQDRVNFGSDGKSIFNMYDREHGKTDGVPVLNSSGRVPVESMGPRGFGPSRRWVDYRDPTYYGRVLRLNRYPTTTGTAIEPLSARTVFLVQDSSKSGGSPFVSVVNGNSGDILSRLASGMAPDPGAPIWRSTTTNVFASGATYLDGREVDGAVDGFCGRPELLTAVGGRAFNVGAFAYYDYPASLTNSTPNVDVGEIQGEILVYDCVLSDETRKGIEAYLMWKWLGTARAGYSVMTNVTVSGEGRLNVESFAQMPKIGASFTGTLALSETSFDFTVTAAGAVQGALSDISGTLELPASCTANVTLERGVPAGEYALVSGAIASETDWTLNLVAPTSGHVSLEVRDGVPLLVVRKKGVVLSIR